MYTLYSNTEYKPIKSRFKKNKPKKHYLKNLIFEFFIIQHYNLSKDRVIFVKFTTK